MMKFGIKGKGEEIKWVDEKELFTAKNEQGKSIQELFDDKQKQIDSLSKELHSFVSLFKNIGGTK